MGLLRLEIRGNKLGIDGSDFTAAWRPSFENFFDYSHSLDLLASRVLVTFSLSPLSSRRSPGLLHHLRLLPACLLFSPAFVALVLSSLPWLS
jgi:hypothetical protein